ncbi:disease resistance protein At4g27190-like [Trifolium pratense]|uniref:disease resistance protein At4g27190-like n=1 Tax=Trifolium pratense TaxID=57577 RepID=UPI001E6910C1|nr:disease resistance protein At4g27190-like [Trifolium pratense]XP_045822331.1 disease resistance protein At4g27190-like [Trifolium pratense]
MAQMDMNEGSREMTWQLSPPMCRLYYSRINKGNIPNSLDYELTRIRLDNVNRRRWKILVATRNEHVCNLMDCQKKIHLGLLSEDESWTLFQKLARIDDEFCELLDEDYHIPIEDLMRYAIGLRLGRTYSLQSTRNLVQAHINKLLDSCLLMHGCVKMHDMVRDIALWISRRSDNHKILVSIDKLEDASLRDCFAASSWWYNKNPIFRQWHSPSLKILLLNINESRSWNSLDISHLTFEGIEELKVFSVTIDYYTSQIIPLLLPPSTHLLTNVRTLRLNGFKFGDISFITSLTRLEVLDLRRSHFNEFPNKIGELKRLKLIDLSLCHIFQKTYNGAIGKCLQLEELYTSTSYPKAYFHEITVDIVTLPKLQRFVLNHPITPEGKKVIQVEDFNISKLKAFKKNIMQIAETISFISLNGGCKNIIPDMVGVVGGMNGLTSLHLASCQKIECIFDATYDFNEDNLICNLVKLRLQRMENLTQLCRDPPMQVLRYLEKLEELEIQHCIWLCNIFPSECTLRNLKILNLSDCGSGEVLFSASLAQSMQQLEQLKISGCNELKHIIGASGNEHSGCNTNEEIIPTQMNSHFLMTKLRDVDIFNCKSLESIFPICYVEGLAQLQKMCISRAPKLEYVLVKVIRNTFHHTNTKTMSCFLIWKLSNRFILTISLALCPENCQAKWPSQSMKMLVILGCPKLAIPWFNLKDDQRQHHLKEIWSFQCLQRLTVGDCDELKFLLSMETHGSLQELMYLRVYDCQELKQIVAENEELVQLPIAELYFSKLKEIEVYNCNKLKSLFPLSMVTMLPQLRTLYLSRSCC